MSVVVAIKDQNKVYIGADSQVTRGSTRQTLTNENNYKIWKVRGVEDHCVMGHVGAYRDATVVRLIPDMISEFAEYKGRVNFEYVVKTVLPKILGAVRDAEFMEDKDYFKFMESSYLFAYKNQLFHINADGSVTEIDDCMAIGSGEDTAIGSLLSTEGKPPKERIVEAIKASAVKDIYVNYPIVITDTEGSEFEIIQDEAKVSKK